MHHRIVKGPRRAVRTVAMSAVVASAAAVALVAVVGPGTASAAGPTWAAAGPTWASAGQATVHPGVMTNTAGGGQCTSNFIFYNATDTFIGQAAHCAGTGVSDRDQRVHLQYQAAGHAGDHLRGQQARQAGVQLVDHHGSAR